MTSNPFRKKLSAVILSAVVASSAAVLPAQSSALSEEEGTLADTSDESADRSTPVPAENP